ncbi:MAG: hypothetical protein SOR40_04240 [Rothia sp. (in: high G+C Gram-positive bacteria)]|nr:hypothetical protein [Rothia sp. (in: high G+C Gram-positive bacteria)]
MSTRSTPTGQGKQVVSPKNVLLYAGTILAFLIGSGFATGQEILQYFTSYGLWGIIGTGGTVLVLMTYVCVEFIYTGRRKTFERPSLIFQYYCGKPLGVFFDYFSILFVYLSFTVMVAGAGAVFEERFGLSKFIGGIGLAVLVVGTVLFGLRGVIEVIGKLGPLIVLIAVALGAYGVISNPGGISEGLSILPSLEVKQASFNWFMSALSYVGFCMLWLAAFLTALGKTAQSNREAVYGGALGGFAFSAACIIVGLGLLAHITEVYQAEVPMLILAQHISPLLAATVSAMVLIGIMTTAVPLLWTVSSRFFQEGTAQFKGATILLALLGTVIGLLLPFSAMVNLVYVINGYVGILLLLLMIIKTVSRFARGSFRHSS